MSLKNILLDVSSVLGLSIDDEAERDYHITKINEAASEIYKKLDIPGCYREQIFQFDDTDTYQISFPWYVGKIRAIRFWNNVGGKIELENLTPRFHHNRWGTQGLLKFRIVKINSTLAKSINNAGLFTFEINDPEAEDIRISIIGKTARSAKETETVTILAGQTSATTLKSYEDFVCEKHDYNTQDITIKDIDNEEMGIIPATLLKPNYTIVNIREDDFVRQSYNSYPLNMVEVLYKHAFVPFRNLYDEFICPDCDKIIFWKFTEHYAAYKPDLEAKALMASAKVESLLRELTSDDDSGKDIKINFGENPYQTSQERLNNSGYSEGFNTQYDRYTP